MTYPGNQPGAVTIRGTLNEKDAILCEDYNFHLQNYYPANHFEHAKKGTGFKV